MKPLFENATVAKTKPTDVVDLTPLPKGALTPVHSLEPAAPAAAPLQIVPPRITEDQVANIGAEAAQALTGVSSSLLGQVKVSNTGEFGQGLNQLVVLAKGLDPDNMKGKGLVGRVVGFMSNTKERLVAQYASVEHQIDALTVQLDGKAALQTQRIGDLETLYTNNFNYHELLHAAQQRCRELAAQVRVDYEHEAGKGVTDGFAAQILGDYQRLIQRLEKRVDDLERAKLLSKQVAPQIRTMQEDARSLVQKFGDVKAVTLPAWKNTFSLYILQLEQKQAVELLNAVDDTTDAALRKGADLLRQNTAAIAESRNRAVVSTETLTHVTRQLVGAAQDVARIDAEAAARRKADEPKLRAMEQELIAAFAPGKR